MNILVTGANGQLGHEMQRVAKNSNDTFVFTDVADGYDKLDITKYDFEKTYSVDLQDGWNVDNMRVVTFVSNFNTDALKRRVYNTQQLACTKTTGITNTTAEAQRPFFVVGGVVVANQGFRVVEVCDIAGRKVSAHNLGAGLYIVKTTDGERVYTQKVIVKH